MEEPYTADQQYERENEPEHLSPTGKARIALQCSSLKPLAMTRLFLGHRHDPLSAAREGPIVFHEHLRWGQRTRERARDLCHQLGDNESRDSFAFLRRQAGRSLSALGPWLARAWLRWFPTWLAVSIVRQALPTMVADGEQLALLRRGATEPNNGALQLLASDRPVAVERPRVGLFWGPANIVDIEPAPQV